MDADERSIGFILSPVAGGACFLKALFIWSRIARGHRVLDAPLRSLPMMLMLLIMIRVPFEEEDMHPWSILYQRVLTAAIWISTVLLLLRMSAST